MSNERKLDSDKTLRELMKEGWTIEELLDAIGVKPTAELEQKFYSEPEVEKPTLLKRITDILNDIGIPAHLKGYTYLWSAIEHVVKNPNSINKMTNVLYPYVAKKHETTASRVERAIRHAIDVAWDRGDVDILHAYFGNTVSGNKGRPTNSEFIAMISNNLRMEGYGDDE